MLQLSDKKIEGPITTVYLSLGIYTATYCSTSIFIPKDKVKGLMKDVLEV